MSDNIKISFIPKQPIAQGGKLRRGRPVIGFPFVMAFIIVALTLIGAGAEVFYKYNRDQIKLEKLAELQDFNLSLEEGPDRDVIEEVRVFQVKTKQVRGLLERHVAPSLIFDFIHEETPEKITFNSFELMLGEFDGFALVNMSGVAPSYEILAYYSLYLDKQKDKILSYEIGAITLNANNQLDFIIEIRYKINALLYSETADEVLEEVTLEDFSESFDSSTDIVDIEVSDESEEVAEGDTGSDSENTEEVSELLDNPESEALSDEESNLEE